MNVSMRPKVSICIPTYKQPEFFRRLLQSIVEQDYKDFEVIVTDDTQDQAVEWVVSEFYSQLPSLRYYKNPTPLGSPENWNEAVRRAMGEYIKIMHHDDWFALPTSLRMFVQMLDENPAVSLAFSASGVYKENKLARVHIPSRLQLALVRRNYRYLFGRNCIGAPSAIIYRKALPVIFDTRYKWVVDVQFYVQCLRLNSHFAHTALPLVNTTSGAPHQVTAQSLGNKEVELYEWTSFFNEIYKGSGFLFALYASLFFVRLFKKHRVQQVDDVPHDLLSTTTNKFILRIIKLTNFASNIGL